MNSAKDIDFGQPRAKLGLTSQELERLDKDTDGNSIISKDSNPKEEDDHEEYYQEQDFKNLTSRLVSKNMNNDLINQIDRDSIPQDKESSLGKTITSLNKTMRLTTLTSGTKFTLHNISKKVHVKGSARLPAIGVKDVRYNVDLNNTSKSNQRLRNNDSKTTLNIMNVTFNSRPGVKDYITHLVGTGTTDGEDVGLHN